MKHFPVSFVLFAELFCVIISAHAHSFIYITASIARDGFICLSPVFCSDSRSVYFWWLSFLYILRYNGEVPSTRPKSESEQVPPAKVKAASVDLGEKFADTGDSFTCRSATFSMLHAILDHFGIVLLLILGKNATCIFHFIGLMGRKMWLNWRMVGLMKM